MYDLFKRNKESFVFLEKYTDQNVSDVNQIKDYVRQKFNHWYNDLTNLSKLKDPNGALNQTHASSIREKITEQLPDLIRLLNTSMLPFIREDVSYIIEDFRRKNFYIPKPIHSSPSGFISLEYLDHLSLYFDPVNSSNSPEFSSALNVCLNHFYEFTRLENYIQIMAFHPQYLEAYLNLFDNLFSLDLPMSQSMRFFIGIIAAAEMRCDYLVNLFARYFITYGGDPDYLNGLSAVPPRWKRLLDLNSKLAHQPWKIDKEQIYCLTHRNASLSENQDVFSVNEILLAIIIMTHVHSLSCFIYGCGINPELDHPNGLTKEIADNDSRKFSFQSTTSHDDKTSDIDEELIMRQFLEVLKLNVITDNSSDEQLVHKKFEEVCEFNSKLHGFQPSEWLEIANDRTLALSNDPRISIFLSNPKSGYSSFTGVPKQFQNQNWTDELIPLVDQLNCDIASGLDMTSKAAYELTYHKVNDVDNVDTSAYRLTIWNIVLSFFGVFSDEYSYEKVDRLLPLKERAFLMRCFTRPYEIPVSSSHMDDTPSSTSPYEYHTLMPALHPSEVVHVMIMAMEARRQACLFYSLMATAECQSMTS